MVVCGGVWWFAVVCGGLRWFVVDCGGLSFSHTEEVELFGGGIQMISTLKFRCFSAKSQSAQLKTCF